MSEDLYSPVSYTFPFERLPARAVIAAMGSCFAADSVARLFDARFHGMQNPNGIVYNPFSIQESLQMLEIGYSLDDFFEWDGQYHSFSHHGSFSRPTAQEALENAEFSRKKFLKVLKKADVFLMTLSSAVVYVHRATDRVVANCHKVPNREFSRELLSAESCRAAVLSACRKIREYNKTCPVILTLSPVRHYPGDLMLNARSKAHLLTAIWNVVEALPDVTYFPAFEILNDELRDYRFYEEDLLHPNAAARRLILERFLSTCCEPRALTDFQESEQRLRRSRHVPFGGPASPAVPPDAEADTDADTDPKTVQAAEEHC